MDSTPLGTNTTNRKTLPSDLIPVGTKFPKPTSPALTTDLPGDSDLDPSISDSSNKPNFSNDTNLSKSKKKKHNRKKNHWKDMKDESSDPSLSDDSYLSYDNDYIHKQSKRNIDR